MNKHTQGRGMFPMDSKKETIRREILDKELQEEIEFYKELQHLEKESKKNV